MKKSSIVKGMLVVLLVGAIMFVLPVSMIHADSETPNPTTTTQPAKEGTHPVLSAHFDFQKDWLARQATNIGRMGDLATKAQTRIDQLKAKGVDTSSLENALAAYQAALPAITAAHDSASQILTVHAGFDDSGSVTDVTQAKTTLESAKSALTDARSKMEAANQALKQALQSFKETHQPKTKPTQTSQSE